MELKICHLYPEVLNLYGDRGNILCMKRRLETRGISCSVTDVGIGDDPDLTQFDLFFIGGGQDFEQEVLLGDLRGGKGSSIRSAVEDGKTFLCICGGYQMMGHYYQTHDGVKCEFLGAVDLYTVGGDRRMIDNYAFELGPESGGSVVVGFENHSGRTFLGEVTISDAKNLFGTYSHGPVLPKNPQFADHILKAALQHRYGSADLEPLDDSMEMQAHERVLKHYLHLSAQK